jgi:hypothetical protein
MRKHVKIKIVSNFWLRNGPIYIYIFRKTEDSFEKSHIFFDLHSTKAVTERLIEVYADEVCKQVLREEELLIKKKIYNVNFMKPTQ